MKHVLVFGSEDFDFDNGAMKLVDYLKQSLPDHSILKMSRAEQLMDFIGKEFVILDVATGIRNPVAITNVKSINYSKKVTAHDMDLAALLRVLNELGQLPEVKIVAIPNDRDPGAFKDEVVSLIKSI